MKNSVLSSLFLLLLGGCSALQTTDSGKNHEPAFTGNNILPWFRDDTDRMLFRAHADVYRYHLGGLLLVKPVRSDSYRLLFITEVGLKILDMELTGDSAFRIHYCMEALNRKPVLETLKSDFSLLLGSVPQCGRIKMIPDRQSGDTIIRTKDSSGVKYFFLGESGRVKQIRYKNGWIKRTDMFLYSSDTAGIDSISISHSPVKMKLFLSKLHENQSEIAE